MLSPASRAAIIINLFRDPRVTLAEPRSTLGFMLPPASRAGIIINLFATLGYARRPRSTLGFMLSPASEAGRHFTQKESC